MTLPCFFEYNYDVEDDTLNDARGVQFVKSRTEELEPPELKSKESVGSKKEVIDITKEIGLETSLLKLGIGKKE